MTKFKLLFIFGMALLFVACHPTIVKKTVSVTTHPDGKRTITVTKEIEQAFDISKTESTKAIVKEFDR